VKSANKLTLACACLFLSATAFSQSPNSVIEEVIEILDTSLAERKDELATDEDALYALIDEILLPRFDRKSAAKAVLSKHWKTATPQQQNDFIDAFYGAMVKRYADGLLEFDQSKVELKPFRGDESKRMVIVKTTVTLADGTKVPVDYRLVKHDSTWLILDVIIEGISYIRNYRSEMDAEIRETGLDAVIARLQREVNGEA
jgi:phospholipid transport system substrate-binding protein